MATKQAPEKKTAAAKKAPAKKTSAVDLPKVGARVREIDPATGKPVKNGISGKVKNIGGGSTGPYVTVEYTAVLTKSFRASQVKGY